MKYILVIWAVLGCLCIGEAASAAERKINCEVTVRERMIGADGEEVYVLIEKKTYPVTEGIKNTTFITNFTLDLTMTYHDSGYFACDMSLFTLGPQAQTFFKRFQSRPGGVYFINDIRCKDTTLYRVGISPLSLDSTAAGGEACRFDYRQDGVWKFDPSANFDFYFVPGSLADARWNLLRDFMEKNYKDFKELFQINFPGKVNCFLSPCVLPEVTWDTRMGYAIDPPRSNLFVLYSHDHNTVDPMPAYLLRIYRFLGYAPPLLAEGMAGYFEFPHYYALELRDNNQLPPVSMLLKSVDYYALPEHDNISAAASFVKYLIDSHGLSKFKQVYDKATDLTVQEQLEAMYDMPLDTLQAEWHHLLDTLTIPTGLFQYFYERERFINRQSGMVRFLDELKARMKTFNDSTYVFTQKGWNIYMEGEYDSARAVFEQLLELEPTNTTHLIVYGNLLLIDAQYDSALTMYDRLLSLDSTMKTALYKIGQTYYRQDMFDSARFYFLRDVEEDPSQLSQASSGIMLGRMALADGDTTAAQDYYGRALAAMEQIYQYGKTWPEYLLRLGQAHLGLALCGESDIETAGSFLESAFFFEVHPTRVIFFTRIVRELGKIADLEGRRDQAISYYQTALKYPLPPTVADEIRGYIETPFSGYAW